ncbi:hypothetical protein HYY71_00930 [Candidatus Woesearchaeota archaeon]|nr:hypothetical protein [Candidatus Woesearchaeota archaeon]
MNKKIFALTAFLLAFGILFSSAPYALAASSDSFSASDVSIDRVRVNGNTFARDRTNFLQDTNDLDVVVSLTALNDISNVHVEAVLTDSSTGNTISDSSGTFLLRTNQSSVVALSLRLIDSLRRQSDFRLDIRVVGADGNTRTQNYGLRFTGGRIGRGTFDVSIDRVRVNGRVVAQSSPNFIDESDNFDVLVEFTALEDLENARVEAVLRDLRSGNVIADSSPNFNLQDGNTLARGLRLELIDRLRQSNSFELTVKIIDAEGDFVQQTYGMQMRGRDGTAGGAGGRALDVSIDNVEVENKILAEGENNFVVIDQGEKKLNLKVRLTSLEDVEDAHVDAVLAFENGDVVADATTTFDVLDGQNTVKDLELPLIGQFEQNSFKLRVKVIDAEGNSEEKLYGLKISQKKFPFIISSVLLSPEGNAEAGKSLVVTLNFKNLGVVPLDGISAKISIPELEVSSTKFLGNIKNSKLPEAKEDFALKISDNVPTGTYTLRLEIVSQSGSESEVKEFPVFILGKSDQARQFVSDRLVINAPLLRQNMKNDGSEVIYPLILTNEGNDAKTYTLLMDGANWADLRLKESNAFIIKPKESKTIYLYASSKGNAIGEQTFVVTIKDNEKALAQIHLKGDVIVAKRGLLGASLKAILKAILIGFAIILALIGLSFGVIKYLQGNNKDLSEETNKEQEVYY